MSADELKSLILGQLSYADLELPNAGRIRVHPYVSGRAMDVYVANAADAKVAFQKMVAASVEDEPASPLALSDEDAEVIARLYAEKEGFLDAYLEARQTTGVFESFHAAFSATEHWRQWKRDQERLEAQLTLHTRLIPKNLELMTRDLNQIISAVPKVTIPTFPVPDFSNWLGTRSIALQLSSTAFLPKLVAVEQFAALSKINLDAWSAIAQHAKWAEAIKPVIPLQTAYLAQLTERVSVADQLMRSHTEVFSSFTQFAEGIRTPAFPFADSLNLAGRAFSGSDDLVRSASDFFGRPVVRPRLIERPSPLADPEAIRAFQLDEEIEETADQSDDIVHSTAEQVILIGNDSITMLKELMGRAIDERLQPFQSILSRMKVLSSPKTFLDVLHEFALHFQREHWKDLWADQGKKYNSKPESIGRLALSMFLFGYCQGAGFVGKELGNGDGFIDVLVNYLGLNHVVEVKIIGASWSVGHAKSGLDQLDAYIQNYSTGPGYLLVFDGRVSTKGEQLHPEYKLKSGATVQVIVVRSYFDRPSA